MVKWWWAPKKKEQRASFVWLKLIGWIYENLPSSHSRLALIHANSQFRPSQVSPLNIYYVEEFLPISEVGSCPPIGQCVFYWPVTASCWTMDLYNYHMCCWMFLLWYSHQSTNWVLPTAHHITFLKILTTLSFTILYYAAMITKPKLTSKKKILQCKSHSKSISLYLLLSSKNLLSGWF